VRFLSILLLLVILVAAAAGGYFWYCIEKPYGALPSEGVFVEIPHGASTRAVGHLLHKNGIVRNSTAFEIYARRHPKRPLQAGEYFFDHALTGKEVFEKLANGDVYQQPFTVKEAETIFEIAHDLQAAKFMNAEEFLKAAKDPALIEDIAPGAKTLEGFLFPATYNLPRHASAADLTAMMTRKFREAIEQISPTASRLDPSKPNETLLRKVTLASLVERETPKPDERPLVAGVFTNRLTKGMLLQCDPTVIYALEEIGKYRGTLSLKDLHYDSPYNTYLHTGLPPGPIGNPGEASLRAAFAPAETDYLYFVANTHGGHFFAATLSEHVKNVAKYRRLLNGQGEEPTVEEANRLPAGSSAHKGRL
jgi:UPF0755 protein